VKPTGYILDSPSYEMTIELMERPSNLMIKELERTIPDLLKLIQVNPVKGRKLLKQIRLWVEDKGNN
jgi:hypothetical protein